MKKYKEIQTTIDVVEKVICDKCGKVCMSTPYTMDLQEWFHYDLIAGYASVFYDGYDYEIDLCQQCFKEVLGPYMRVIGRKN